MKEMLAQGWPVLTVLLGMSIFSVTVIVDRFMAYRRARLDARRLVRNILRAIESQGITGAVAYVEKFDQPAAVAARAVLLAGGGRAGRERALQHAVQSELHRLEVFVPALGTIATTAPFVGLLGTVIGIIKAFVDISQNVGGGPEVVASGIAEALVTTACGLLVAIPAVAGYNYCVRQEQRLADEIDLAMFGLVERLSADEGQAA